MAKDEAWIPGRKQVHLLGLFDPRADEDLVSLSLEQKGGQGGIIKGWTRLRLPASLSPFFFYSAFDNLARYSSWYFRDREYEESAQTYFSHFGESERAKGRRMRLPKEPGYRKPRNKETPGFIGKAFRMGRLTDRQRLKEGLIALSRETPFGVPPVEVASLPSACSRALLSED